MNYYLKLKKYNINFYLNNIYSYYYKLYTNLKYWYLMWSKYLS